MPLTLKRAFTLMNASYSQDIWKFKNQLDIRRRYFGSFWAQRRIAQTTLNFNAILQIGSTFDLSPYARRHDIPCFSYHDNNIYGYLAGKNNLPERPRLIRKAVNFEKTVYQNLTGVFTMSRTLRNRFIDDFRLPEDKVFYAGFGCPFAGLHLPVKDYTRKTILFVASHSFSQKGGEILLEAFRKVRKTHPDARLILAGQTLSIDQPGVECVGFLDKRSKEGLIHYSQLYQDATLFVLPSYNEAFGEVFLEAMAHKVPCIGTDCCAMPEIICQNNSGSVIPPGDSSVLADEILQYFENPNTLEQLGRHAYEVINTEYTWENVIDRIRQHASERMLS
ncbi:glycosyltransferase family 4 protein [Aquisalimonas sp. 2447]|uniref:glycosyltransferase family 4 protein n=1 Tax=Aquisalimonas sp. 2447 TaxID=2740807 RepID=UPI00143234BD|nr:glycosyltransferase family 4 protein [Aquisalimonas sp. 2447]QIT56566.1 glycosyltransferase family 4 protein [Aquisalimonas sp. 2447]